MSRLRRRPGTADYLQKHDHIILEPEKYKGKWRQYFGNDRPLHAEFGMGKGQFIAELSAREQEINFIGLDRYDELIRKASEKAFDTGAAFGYDGVPPNLALVLGNVEQMEEIFAPGELERIYLNFSDPWPKKRHAKRRLTHPRFLQSYERILNDHGEIHLKTDSPLLFEFSLNNFLEAGWGLRNISLDVHRDGTPEDYIFTEYERKFAEQGQPIYRCEFFKKK